MSDNKKQPEQQYSEEELLKLAEQNLDPNDAKISDAEEKLTDVHRFVKDLNIQPGTTRVPTGIIYLAYRDWCKGKPKHKLPFGKIFGTMFQRGREWWYMYYLLDPTPFDLSEKNFRRLRDDNMRKKALKSKLQREVKHFIEKGEWPELNKAKKPHDLKKE